MNIRTETGSQQAQLRCEACILSLRTLRRFSATAAVKDLALREQESMHHTAMNAICTHKKRLPLCSSRSKYRTPAASNAVK